MTAIGIQCSHSRADDDFFAMDFYRVCSVFQNPPKYSGSLAPDEQYRALIPPKPVLETVTNATGLTHAAGSDDKRTDITGNQYSSG
jgi:hypothetical protein